MPLIDRLLGRTLALRSGEAATALLMFAYSFLAMTAYNILKPLTRSQFIEDLGSDNIPYVLLATGLFIGVLMHLYTGAIRRLPLNRVIPATQSAIIAAILAFWVLLQIDAAWVSVAFYVFGQVLGIFLISQFWTLANDVYDARQAKRLFGFIGGGASLGGAMGAKLTSLAVQEVGTGNLLLVAAAVLACCVGLVRVIRRTQGTGIDAGGWAGAHGVGIGEAIRLLGDSRHLRVVALVVGFAAAGAAVVEQQLNMAAEAMRGDAGAAGIAAFLAEVTFYVSIAGFVVQVALTSRIHRSFGLAFALLLLPVGLGISATVILVSGALWAPVVARVLDATLRYTVDKTTREVLFLPLPGVLKYRAKPFIDVTMDRLAKALAALLMLGLIKPWGLGFDWRELSYASLTMTGAWIGMALYARREYLKAFRESIGHQGIAPEAIQAVVADAATIETLVEELANPGEPAVLYAIDMLEALDKRNLITPLLLHHDSPKVRARTLLALAAIRSRVGVQWSPVVERMVQDADVDVRAAALRALAALAQEDAMALMRRHLDDPEPRVAVAAVMVLAQSSQDTDRALAEAALKRLIADTRDTAAAGRQEAATSLAHIRDRRFRPLLVPLLHDHHVPVVHEAIRTARVLGADDGLFLPRLISLLGDRRLKSAARDTLVGYGTDAVAALRHRLLDRGEHAWVRRHIPATLARMPAQASMDALIAALDDPDGFLRYKAIAAIGRLRQDHPGITVPHAVVEKRLVQETSRYYNYLTLHFNLLRHDPLARASLIDRGLLDKLERTLDRIYLLLGLLYDAGDVAAARYSIEHGDNRRRAAAIEYLDNLLGGVVRSRVLPLLDDAPIAEKVRRANLVLKTRPRELEDTLAQLVHDDDPAIAAGAIHLVASRSLRALADDLEYVTTHRSREDCSVSEAASWALGTFGTAARSDVRTSSLPAVEVANRIRHLPLFASVSIDELFRVADAGCEVRHPAGRALCVEGARVEDLELLVEGIVAAEDGRTIDAPAALALDDVLRGTPASVTLRARTPIICFRLRADDFLTMVSDNVLLAQGLFRTLLAPARGGLRRPAYAPSRGMLPVQARAQPLQPIDKALLLRQHPILGTASAEGLLALTAVAPEVRLTAGTVLFEPGDPAAVCLILEGEVLLESDAATPVPAPAGATLGVQEALAGLAWGWRGTVTRDGSALRVGRDEMFDVLGEHPALMQSLFAGVLSWGGAAAAVTADDTPAQRAAAV